MKIIKPRNRPATVQVRAATAGCGRKIELRENKIRLRQTMIGLRDGCGGLIMVLASELIDSESSVRPRIRSSEGQLRLGFKLGRKLGFKESEGQLRLGFKLGNKLGFKASVLVELPSIINSVDRLRACFRASEGQLRRSTPSLFPSPSELASESPKVNSEVCTT